MVTPTRRTLVDDVQDAMLAYLARMHDVAAGQNSRTRYSTTAVRDMLTRIDEVLADKTPARPGEWCAFDEITGAPVVPDLTRGAWPDRVCNKRGLFTVELVNPEPGFRFPGGGTSTSRPVTCTRIAGHTGRHAAASGGRIVAVWGERP